MDLVCLLFPAPRVRGAVGHDWCMKLMMMMTTRRRQNSCWRKNYSARIGFSTWITFGPTGPKVVVLGPFVRRFVGIRAPGRASGLSSQREGSEGVCV